MAEENAEAQEAQEEAAGGGGGGKSGNKLGTFIIIIIGFLVMILTPVITVFLVKAQLPKKVETESVANEDEGKEIVINLDDPILVNIAETKGTRVLRLKAHLVLSELRLQENLTERKPMLRDRIMLAASRKTIDELEGPEGRDSLKRDIMNEINAQIKDSMEGAVIEVYFSEFLIQ